MFYSRQILQIKRTFAGKNTMRFLIVLLIGFAAFACKNKPSAEDTSWRELLEDTTLNPSPPTNNSPSPYVFTDTILVSIHAKDFAAVLKEKPNMPILDLRTPEEYKRGHVWRSNNMNMLDKDFDRNLSSLSRTQEYAVYCQFGDKSFEVAEKMKRLGFKRIYHLQKGLMNWGESGQALQLK